MLSHRGDDDHSIDGYAAWRSRRPVLGGLLVFFLLAQAGIPLTGGFIAKLEVFSAASQRGRVRAGRRSAPSRRWSRRSPTCGSSLAVAKPETAEEEAEPRARLRIGHRVDLWTGLVLAVTAAMTLILGIVARRVRRTGPSDASTML